jgi:hypothetical protein
MESSIITILFNLLRQHMSQEPSQSKLNGGKIRWTVRCRGGGVVIRQSGFVPRTRVRQSSRNCLILISIVKCHHRERYNPSGHRKINCRESDSYKKQGTISAFSQTTLPNFKLNIQPQPQDSKVFSTVNTIFY